MNTNTLKRSTWFERLPFKLWLEECNDSFCKEKTLVCPGCGKPCHIKKWTDQKARDQIILFAQHTHFISRQYEQRRNCYHKITIRKVKPVKTFKRGRRIADERKRIPKHVRSILNISSEE